MKKKVCSICLIIMSVIWLTACGAELEKAAESNVTTENYTSTEADIDVDEKYPMTVTDQAGREIILKQKPQSIVSSYYITTSTLLALDLKEEMKGIESNPERRSIYEMCAPEVLELKQVGSPKEFDIEACASLAPDLVLIPMRAKDMVEPLEKLGITVMVVNPESRADLIEMIQMIGAATDKAERAEELVDYIESKLKFLEEQLEGCDRPKVYLGGNSSFLSTASSGMYQNDQITLAGGQNVAGEIDDTYWVESSYEQILSWNPQVIVLAADANYSIEDIQSDANLADCSAISEQNVYQIPSDIEAWDSPVPSSFLGAVYMASVIHPDLVSEEQYKEMVEEYYERFYGFSYAAK